MILGKRGTKISKTSVVISTYNDAEYLKRLIPTVINQSLNLPFFIHGFILHLNGICFLMI